jgi:6-phosphogluconolactonase
MDHFRVVRSGARLWAAKVAALCAGFLLAGGPVRGAEYWMYAGTYSTGGSRGIYAFRFETGSGKMTPAGVAAVTANPSFLVAHPNREVLFAVNEEGSETAPGSVSSFSINPKNGKLGLLSQVSSRGGAPCHLALDRSGRWLAVANYASGSVAVLPVAADGKLGEASALVQQKGSSVNRAPHAHAVAFSPDNRFLLVADLGADQIFIYRFDAAEGRIAPNDPPSADVQLGAGVRHLVFHPNGKALYAINELASSVTMFRYDAARGALEDLQTVSTLPEGYKGKNTAAEIAIDAAGARVYASNRGHDSLALLGVDPVLFTLTAMEFPSIMGRTPRHFALDPEGKNVVVACQDSGLLLVFRVHPATGQIQPRMRTAKVANPVCVAFVAMR